MAGARQPLYACVLVERVMLHVTDFLSDNLGVGRVGSVDLKLLIVLLWLR